MPLKHVNAYKVFPPEIVEEIQKYYQVVEKPVAKPVFQRPDSIV